MNKYLFLISWAAGSDGANDNTEADDGDTQVNDQADLLPQFLAGNEDVFAVEITAPTKDIAIAYGRAAAWDNDYTNYDTISNTYIMSELTGNIPETNEQIVVELESAEVKDHKPGTGPEFECNNDPILDIINSFDQTGCTSDVGVVDTSCINALRKLKGMEIID